MTCHPLFHWLKYDRGRLVVPPMCHGWHSKVSWQLPCLVPVLRFDSVRLTFVRANPHGYDRVESARCDGFITRRGTDIGEHETAQAVLVQGEAKLETPFAASAE